MLKPPTPTADALATLPPAAQRGGAAWQAVRGAMTLLAHDDDITGADWQALLAAAVAAVPGAEAGSLSVREGESFVYRAQVGFGGELIGARLSAQATFAWYGGAEARWRAGEPSQMCGAEIERRSRLVSAISPADATLDEVYESAGKADTLQAVLCMPVPLHGQVVAHLNLDNLSSARPFAEEALEVAREFVDLTAALLAANDRRRRERARAAELEASLRRGEALAQLSLALEEAHTPDEVAARALQVLSRNAGVGGLALWYLDGERYWPRAFYGAFTPELRAALSRGLPLHGRAPFSAPVYIERAEAQGAKQHGIGSVAMLPMPGDSGAPELLGAYRHGQPRPWTPTERELLEAAARSVAVSLERVRHLAQLEATREGALKALGLALEARDFETHGHTERVVALSSALGEALGLAREECEALRQGAYLHDFGKVAIPDHILLKPGKLTPEEWTLMQSHTVQGHLLAQNVPTLPTGALDVIRFHHERWDGAGYPQRLAGEAIPRLARIFAVCDVYDALTSARPYKAAWPAEQALDEIATQAGKQFDPEVVARFLKISGQPQTPVARGERAPTLAVKPPNVKPLNVKPL